jgi:hypothetical protein
VPATVPLAELSRTRSGQRPVARAFALKAALEREWLCAVALCWFISILFVLGPRLFTQDSWLTLVAGREVAHDGFPRTDTLAVLTRGRDWVDQQWLGQLIYYGAESLWGLRLVFVLQIVALAGAMGAALFAARRHGGSLRSVALLVPGMFLAAPWAWDMRAQALGYLPFVLLLALLAGNQVSPRRRVLFVVPLLVLWANLHGSVLLGSALVAIWALTVISRGRRISRGERLVAALTGVCGTLSSFASPYALSLPGYYSRLLLDPPFHGLIVEWKRTTLTPSTVIFWLALALLALVVLRARPRLTPFELVVLVALAGLAADAVRNIVWFVLAMAVLLPRAVDGLVPRLARRARGRLDAYFLYTMLAATAVLGLFSLRSFDDRMRALWPPAAADRVSSLARQDPDTRVYASERVADWLLWQHPEDLRGRIAYDARLELLTAAEVDRIVSFQSGLTIRGWPASDYVLIALAPHDAAVPALQRSRRYRTVVDDRRIVVLARA